MNHDISPFFALLSHIPKIDRWNKSKCIDIESLSSHSLQVSMFTYTLACLEKKFNPDFSEDPYELAFTALFHDVSEVISEDVNGLYKQMSPKIQELSQQIEQESCEILFRTVPKSLSAEFQNLIFQKKGMSVVGRKLIKAADTLSALAKATEEMRCGNLDFKTSVKNLKEMVESSGKLFQSVQYFTDIFMPAFDMPVDDLIPLLKDEKTC